MSLFRNKTEEEKKIELEIRLLKSLINEINRLIKMYREYWIILNDLRSYYIELLELIKKAPASGSALVSLPTLKGHIKNIIAPLKKLKDEISAKENKFTNNTKLYYLYRDHISVLSEKNENISKNIILPKLLNQLNELMNSFNNIRDIEYNYNHLISLANKAYKNSFSKLINLMKSLEAKLIEYRNEEREFEKKLKQLEQEKKEMKKGRKENDASFLEPGFDQI